MSSRTVLVTGITGFVASHVAHKLLLRGYIVRGSVRAEPTGSKLNALRSLIPKEQPQSHLTFVTIDLLDPVEKWIAAVDGVDAVLHVASPFPIADPKDENEVILPAVDGTLNVLKAVAARNAKQPGAIKRVVLTSSVAAVSMVQTGRPKDYIFTEKDWPLDIPNLSPYQKSKTLAEKAAWDFVNSLPGEQRFELATINPSYIQGPVLLGDIRSSGEILTNILTGKFPFVPRLSMGICDVRDVAEAHVLALEKPEAAGHRHIISTQTLWFSEIAQIVKKTFAPMGYSISTGTGPDFMIHLASWFDPVIRATAPLLGVFLQYSRKESEQRLGLRYTDVEKTLVEMSHSLIQNGIVPKKAGYHQ